MNSKLKLLDFHGRLANGSESAAFELDDLFRERLCRLVDREMNQLFKRRQDPEDIVQSVMKSFYVRAGNGEFSFEDRTSLWGLLSNIARNKLRTRIRHHQALKRDIHREQYGEEVHVVGLEPNEAQAHLLGRALEIALSRSPTLTPEIFQLQLFGFSLDEIVDIVLRGLPAAYTRILQLKLQGSSESAIAEELGIGREAVRYKLKRIQERLASLLAEQET